MGTRKQNCEDKAGSSCPRFSQRFFCLKTDPKMLNLEVTIGDNSNYGVYHR